MLRASVDRFEFELSQMTFIDLAGIEPILDMFDGRAVIRSSSRAVDRILEVAGLEEFHRGREGRSGTHDWISAEPGRTRFGSGQEEDVDDERAEPLFESLPDEDARAELFELYRPLASHLANRYVKRGIEVDDLEQVAAIGLLNAIDRYDPDYGSRFVSFAVPTITGELKKHFRDTGWGTRVPRRMKEVSMLSRRANEELCQRLGRSPTIEEVAEEIDVPVDDVVDAAALGSAYRPDTLDAPVLGDDLTHKDRLGEADGRVDLMIDLETLMPLLERRPHRERRILWLRFYEDLTQRQIADEMGISQMHVSRILSSTLENLGLLMEV